MVSFPDPAFIREDGVWEQDYLFEGWHNYSRSIPSVSIVTY